MKGKKVHLIIAIGAFSLIIAIFVAKFHGYGQELWKLNEQLLKKQILSLEENLNTINLSNITPFEWDEVYSFETYTPKDKIYKLIGYKWDDIHETVSEEMNQIVFLKDKKVVCDIYGYPSNNGYGISFNNENYENGVAISKSNENLNFKITRSDNIIYLKQ